jgi:hypothetical protein
MSCSTSPLGKLSEKKARSVFFSKGFQSLTLIERVHRTFFERFSYLAVYECWDCKAKEFGPHLYTYHLGEQARCPKCGTYRAIRLAAPDKINSIDDRPAQLPEAAVRGQALLLSFLPRSVFRPPAARIDDSPRRACRRESPIRGLLTETVQSFIGAQSGILSCHGSRTNPNRPSNPFRMSTPSTAM